MIVLGSENLPFSIPKNNPMNPSQLVHVTDQSAISVQHSAERAQSYARQSKAASTVRAYAHDWEAFQSWCLGRGMAAMPADPRTVALYLADLAVTAKVATIARRLAAISKAHQVAGFDSPASLRHAAVSEVWKGIRRVHGTAQEQKAPVLIDDVRRMVSAIQAGSNELLATRDRALVLVGFAGAFRRSELVGLDVEDVQVTSDGLVITLRRSKTDQQGEGRKVGIPYGSTSDTCPVRSLKLWMDDSGITSGPLFRGVNRHCQLQERLTDQSIALVVKRYALAAGLDPANYAGHSLRAGLVTSAAIAGVSERAIMKQTGHKSTNMVRRYIRDANLFRENAASRIGL
jgi:integrase